MKNHACMHENHACMHASKSCMYAFMHASVCFSVLNSLAVWTWGHTSEARTRNPFFRQPCQVIHPSTIQWGRWVHFFVHRRWIFVCFYLRVHGEGKIDHPMKSIQAPASALDAAYAVCRSRFSARQEPRKWSSFFFAWCSEHKHPGSKRMALAWSQIVFPSLAGHQRASYPPVAAHIGWSSPFPWQASSL